MVELEGYQASKAADCRSALKMLNTQRFEVVLCDVFPTGWKRSELHFRHSQT